MTTSVSQYSSHHTSGISHLYRRNNVSAGADRSESASTRTEDVSNGQSGRHFNRYETGKTGSLSQSDLLGAFQQMGSQTRSTLLQAQEVSSNDEAGAPPDPSEMFASLDTDTDGKISRDEFITGKPEDMSSDQAGAMYDDIAGDTTDGLTADQLAEGLRPAGGPPPRPDQSDESADSQSNSTDDMLAELLAALQNGSASGTQGSQGMSPPDPTEMFSKLDTDSDGKVSRDEFVAGRPSDASESQSSSFFDKISGDNGDSLTQDQFVTGFNNAAPKPQDASGASGTTSTASTDDMTNQLLEQLAKAIRSYQSSSYQNGIDTGSITSFAA